MPKGFTQAYGIDYRETFAPIAKLNTIYVLISLVSKLDWPLNQLDIKNAFLNGDLEEEVYMDILPELNILLQPTKSANLRNPYID